MARAGKNQHDPWEEDALVKQARKADRKKLALCALAGAALMALAVALAYIIPSKEEPQDAAYDPLEFLRDPSFAGNAPEGGDFRFSKDDLLQQLKKHRVSCVYDADGEAIPLFDPGEGESQGGYVARDDVALPDGPVYIDEIQSGYYTVYKGELYFIWANRPVEEVPMPEANWLGVYDSVVKDDQTGKLCNVRLLPACGSES